MNRPNQLLDVVSLFDAWAQDASRPIRVLQATSANRPATGRSIGMPIDCYATNDHAVVLASMPGVHPEDISVSVQKDMLTISGSVSSDRKHEDTDGSPVTWYLAEIARGSYERRMKLPFAINEDAVEAQFSNGMLRIVLPRLEAAKPHRISVQVLNGSFPELGTETASDVPEEFSAD